MIMYMSSESIRNLKENIWELHVITSGQADLLMANLEYDNMSKSEYEEMRAQQHELRMRSVELLDIYSMLTVEHLTRLRRR